MEGLRKRLLELHTEYTRQGKHEHRNELGVLLDELLRQQGIERWIYNIGCGIADEEEDDDDDEEEEEEEDKMEVEMIKTLIQSTIEYSIH